MSDIRVPRDSLQNLVRQASQQIAQTAGTAAAQQAEALLNEITESVFQDAKGPAKIADRLPNALERLTTQLKGLGIDAATVGEVLNRLAEQLGAQRQMRPGRTLKSALAGNDALLESHEAELGDERKEELREAIDSQEDAANLLAKYAAARDLAKKGRFGKV